MEKIVRLYVRCCEHSTDFACDPCRDITVSTNHATPACTSIFVCHACLGKIARSAIALGERSDLCLPCQHYSQERHRISHGMICAYSGISVVPVSSFNQCMLCCMIARHDSKDQHANCGMLGTWLHTGPTQKFSAQWLLRITTGVQSACGMTARTRWISSRLSFSGRAGA